MTIRRNCPIEEAAKRAREQEREQKLARKSHAEAVIGSFHSVWRRNRKCINKNARPFDIGARAAVAADVLFLPIFLTYNRLYLYMGARSLSFCLLSLSALGFFMLIWRLLDGRTRVRNNNTLLSSLCSTAAPAMWPPFSAR